LSRLDAVPLLAIGLVEALAMTYQYYQLA